MITDIYSSEKKYGIIYTDPPWQQKKGGLRKSRPAQGRTLDYPTMAIKDIEQVHRHVLENLTEEHHNVFIWTIDKYLHEAEQMMARLGYTLHARMIWNKGNGIAPAFTVRFAHEYLLWFYPKGKMLKPAQEQRGVYTTVFTEKGLEHSRKPEIAYKMLEEMFPQAERLELFARSERDSWDCWGNEFEETRFEEKPCQRQ